MKTITTPAVTITINPDVERAHALWQHCLEASRDADRAFWTALGDRKKEYDRIGKWYSMPKRIQNADHEARERWFQRELKAALGPEILKLYLARRMASTANSTACSQFYAFFPDHNSDQFQRELAAFVLKTLDARE